MSHSKHPSQGGSSLPNELSSGWPCAAQGPLPRGFVPRPIENNAKFHRRRPSSLAAVEF